ncbi:MAG TPA: ECF-type sigma factor, partial [Gemmataceae bacterium]|nr:ECF-type sigma factor [Gemmataceae bacterium]
MDEQNPVTDLFKRLEKGDPQAAEKLFDYYAQRLVRYAEQHLSRKLAGRLDGEDVVQSVFRTFFRRSLEGEFRIDSSSDVWRLLLKITLLKARAIGRRETAAKRDVRAEATGEGDAWWHEVQGREPGPEEAAVLVDEIEALLRGRPAWFGEVLEMRLQGRGISEIAAELSARQ